MPQRPHSRDALSLAERSALMGRIGPKDSKPELAVRRFLHRLGYRFRLHRKDLPGTPDIVFPVRRKAIFVHGCFWHRHPDCRYSSTPKTRTDFWLRKFADNIARDRRNVDQLEAAGWDVLTIWSCETTKVEMLEDRLRSFLDSPTTAQAVGGIDERV